MKRILAGAAMFAISAFSLFAQEPQIKAKTAAEAAQPKKVADLQKKIVEAKAQFESIKAKILEETRDRVKSEFLLQSKIAKIGLMGRIVRNSPYSAEAITETRQVLADGTRIAQSNSYKIYRDSQGRVRRDSESGMEYSIVDPVAKATWVVDVQNQTARKMPLALAIAGTDVRALIKVNIEMMYKNQMIIARAMRPESKDLSTTRESLGRQVIEGVEVEGSRVTKTIPINTIGNDRPIEIVQENWYSPELQLDLMSRKYDPRTGEITCRLSGIRRSEPPADLFQVPAEYKIVSGK